MSRASAVAYDLPVALPLDKPVGDGWPGRGDSSAYRLLGDAGLGFGGPVPLILDAEPEESFGEQSSYDEEPVGLPDAYLSMVEEQAQYNRKWLPSRRLLVGLAVAALLALALMLVTPVLAMVPAGAPSLSVSRYSELGAGAQAETVSAPDIDTSTGAVAPPVSGPQPSAGDGQYSLVAAPSISVGQIESVLAKYGSPAVGQGQTMYDLGVQYGIDPAYALAFFVHESACGTRGVARFTHSLGNIRWTDGYDNYQGYRSYATWKDGMEDWYKLITDLYINGWGLRTVDQIIPVYAPAADGNSPPTYAASVESMVDSWRGK